MWRAAARGDTRDVDDGGCWGDYSRCGRVSSGCDERAPWVRAMRRREGRRLVTTRAALAARIGSGRSVRRRVWGSGCEGWRNILGHDGVLEAVPILLGAAIGHATVLHDPPRVTSAAIGHATVLLCIPPVCNVLLCILPVCNVLLCILIGLERVGMPRRRVRRHLRCHGVDWAT